MAFFPIAHYRRYDDPLDRYFGDQLDFFNPWDDLNTAPSPTTLVIVPKNFRWVNQPQQSTHAASHGPNANAHRKAHSQKFRVQLNVAGFNPETINTKVEGKKVIIEAKQEERQEDGDYNIRQLRKSYELPEQAGRCKRSHRLDILTSRCSRCHASGFLHHTQSHAGHRGPSS